MARGCPHGASGAAGGLSVPSGQSRARQQQWRAGTPRLTAANSLLASAAVTQSSVAASPQVEDLNAKWQRYDASRDEYVRGLHAQLQGLQAPPEPERSSCPELMRKEISRLNRQLEEKMGVCAAARRELAAVRGAHDAALERVQMLEQQVARGAPGGRGGGLPPSRVTAERLASLQILAYKDDFTSERADRERAQSRIQELEEQVASLRQQASWTQVGSQGFAPRSGSAFLSFFFS